MNGHHMAKSKFRTLISIAMVCSYFCLRQDVLIWVNSTGGGQ